MNMETILSTTRKLNKYFQYNSEIDFFDVAELLSSLTDADIVIVDADENIVGRRSDIIESDTLSEEYSSLISKGTLENIMVGSLCCTSVPVLCKNGLFYTIIAVIPDLENGFNSSQVMLLENAAFIISLKILHKAEAEEKHKLLQKSKIQAALSVLSYSETQAAVHVLGALENKTEGLLIASKIADTIGITRSVIVNALRKLESATLIEAKSLGMKGTFIRILNPLLLEEIKKKSNVI